MNIKKRSIIGMDISKDTFNAHWGGNDRKHRNTRAGWQKLLKEAPEGACYAMEATGNYHYRLAAWLHSKGCAVLVLNPYRVRMWVLSVKGRKDKTDRIDARDIALYAGQKQIKHREWKPMPPKLARARVIVSLLSGLAKTKQAARCRSHAVSLVMDCGDGLLGAMAGISEFCESKEAALEKELYRLMGEIYPDKFRLLKSVPGIGAKTAAVLLVCAKGLDFETQRNISSFAGLAPMAYESGASVRGKGRISKAGNPYLRAVMFMGAMSAAVYCKPCKDLYERLLAKGKPTTLAQVAVMHRLLKIAFGVVRSGEPYRGGGVG